MRILNKFPDRQIEVIAGQIHQMILREINLTNRNLGYIKRMLKNCFFYISLEKEDKINGFIAKEKLIGNYYEVKSWYVTPENRGSGLADKLLLKSIEDLNNNYLSNTFETYIVIKLKSYGFKQISISDLPWKVILYYILTRNVNSIIKHLFSKRSYLLLKS